MSSTRILLVEDDPVAALLVEDLLHAEGLECIGVAANGAEAIRLATARQPDLAILDIVLPGGMDGIETAHALAGLGAIKVLYLTSSTDEATFIRARATAPVAYIAKPFADVEVRQAITVALDRLALEQRLETLVAERTADLVAALHDSREISTAVGLLMARHGVGPEEAFARLRQQARSERQRVADLARALIRDVNAS
ncbi:MAG: response regulator [Betaproteobacteria bacterium]|nr:response regulator [Betaproteobacteria bacterium]